MQDFIEELNWRGMIHDIMPGTEEQLKKQKTAAYIGFDPTASSLHIGNLVQIMLLVHLQRCGHKPFALVGGATGMVGDPSGKSTERNLLNEEELKHNQSCIKSQLSYFLDFESRENAAEMVNNYQWFKDMGFIEFLRDVGKHITVNYMTAKDSVKSRLETGLSFTEFSYQLMQGYDFYWLYKERGVKLQMGGSDQWGNIVTGTEIIRRKTGGEAFALTTPLVTKADGSKFGKTEQGNVWLDPERTSPYQFYQFWLNCADDDAQKLIRIFSVKTRQEIETLEATHLENPHLRILQKELAREITIRVHSEDNYTRAVKASGILFGKSTADELKEIDEKMLLEVFEGVPQVTISKSVLHQSINVTDFLSELTSGYIFKSKGEARRMITAGGVSINKTKLQDAEQVMDFELINNKYLLVQKGKKNYFLVKAE
ncbi:MAG: tyrosine--tRNA ligase [Cyclobacteriaceae bacterium]|nr:MAG: tyrosine--tRNA ligase [Cyclobacteriaceae bacterium]